MAESTNTNARRLVWVAAVLAATGTALVIWFVATSRTSRSSDGAATAKPSPVVIEDAGEADDDVDLRLAVATDEEPIVAAKNGEEIHGLVLDIDGQPVASVGITQRGVLKSKLVARSGADGTFTATLARLDGSLVSARGAWATVAPCKLMPSRKSQQHVLVVARSIDISGRVVDERGQGVAAASLGLRMAADSKLRLPTTADVPSDILISGSSDATGAFALWSVPVVAGSRLLASCEPLQPFRDFAPTTNVIGLQLVLRDPVDAMLIEGVVVEADQSPAVTASVKLGEGRASTGIDGRFRMALQKRQLARLDPRTPLLAQSTGIEPRKSLIDDFGRVVLDAQRADASVAPVVLTLGAEELTITGTVVEADGRALAIVDPDPFQSPNIGEVEVADGTLTNPSDSWRVVLEQSSPIDARSNFELRGLLDRDYVLECTLPERKLRFRSDPIHAGAKDVVLRIPADPTIARVLGHVVAPDGTPIPGAQLSVRFRDSMRPLGGPNDPAQRLGDSTADASGGFALLGVPRQCAWLVVTGNSIEQETVELDRLDLASDLRIVVRRLVAITFEGLDSRLEWVRIDLIDGHSTTGGVRGGETWKVEGGSGGALVGEGSYTLVLKSNGKEILRCDVEVIFGKKLVVRP